MPTLGLKSPDKFFRFARIFPLNFCQFAGIGFVGADIHQSLAFTKNLNHAVPSIGRGASQYPEHKCLRAAPRRAKYCPAKLSKYHSTEPQRFE